MTRDYYANITIRGTTSASVADTWALVTDWPAQSRWIAFTKVTIDREANGVGTRFTGRTQVGPIWFDDPMEVMIWEPPTEGKRGYCKVRKFGPWLLGTAEIVVEPAGNEPDRTTVTWKEAVTLRGVPAIFNPLVRAMGGILFRMTMRRAITELDVGSRES